MGWSMCKWLFHCNYHNRRRDRPDDTDYYDYNDGGWLGRKCPDCYHNDNPNCHHCRSQCAGYEWCYDHEHEHES